jgi:hypothetical protein
MTAERRQYWAVYPTVIWRYYGPCTTMHEFSRVLQRSSGGRSSGILPFFARYPFNKHQYDTASRCKVSAEVSVTYSRTSTNRTLQEVRSHLPFLCLNSEFLYKFWLSTIIRNNSKVLKCGVAERWKRQLDWSCEKLRIITKSQGRKERRKSRKKGT